MTPTLRSIAVLLGLMVWHAAAEWANASVPGGEPAYQTVWLHQFGTDGWNRGFGISTDGQGNVYTAGETVPLNGPEAGNYDAFINKYTSTGGAVWAGQFGTTANDFGNGVSADPLGNVFLTGYSQIPPGGPNAGGYQAFITRYAPDGTFGWTQSLGTPQTYSYGVSADGLGNAYIAGSTLGSVNGANAGGYDAYVAKYNSAGNLQWASQFGTASQDQAYGVSADGLGNVYVTGATTGALVAGQNSAGKNDAFLTKYNAYGTVQWTQQIGTSGDDIARAVSADALGNVFIAGSSSGGLGAANSTSLGLDDAFVSKFAADGTLQWTKQIGTTSNDYISATATDGHGDVFVAGYTQGSLGKANAGNYDGFVSKLDAAGDVLWTRQLGTSAADYIGGITVDAQGNVFISGSTLGSLEGTNQGSYDAWIARLSPPVLGDMNHDFQLTNLDIQALISALADPTDFKLALGLTDDDFLALGDVNHDGKVTAADISALMNLMAGGSIPSPPNVNSSVSVVPEPASALLLVIGGAVLLGRRFRFVRKR